MPVWWNSLLSIPFIGVHADVVQRVRAPKPEKYQNKCSGFKTLATPSPILLNLRLWPCWTSRSTWIWCCLSNLYSSAWITLQLLLVLMITGLDLARKLCCLSPRVRVHLEMVMLLSLSQYLLHRRLWSWLSVFLNLSLSLSPSLSHTHTNMRICVCLMHCQSSIAL